LNRNTVELDSANFNVNSLSSELLQSNIKLNLIKKTRENYDQVTQKLNNQLVELRQFNSEHEAENRSHRNELNRLRDQISSYVINDEVLRNKLSDNQVILEQTVSN
jgi:hypothetical protein